MTEQIEFCSRDLERAWESNLRSPVCWTAEQLPAAALAELEQRSAAIPGRFMPALEAASAGRPSGWQSRPLTGVETGNVLGRNPR